MESKCGAGRNTEVSEMSYQDDNALRSHASSLRCCN